MNKKIKKKLIMMLTILLLVLLLLINIVVHLRKKEEAVNTPAMPAEELAEFIKENKILTYKNLTKISFVEGLTATEVTEELEEIITKYIPSLYDIIENFNENELRNYYLENENTIKRKLTIKSEEEFLELLNNWRRLQTEMDLYEYCEYLENESEIDLHDESKNIYKLAFDIHYRNGSSWRFYLNINK